MYALVTGGSRGIGRAVAVRLAKMGYNVLINYMSNDAEAQKTLEMIREAGTDGELLKFDVSSAEEAKTALESWQAAHPDDYIDVLVNNAGVVLPSKAFLMTDMDQVRESFDVNFFAQTEITQIVCRAMIRNRKGSIVNMASIAAFTGIEGQFEYVSGKSAIVGMTKKLSKELAAYGIRVNAVAPGMINTEMIMQMEDSMREGLKERLVAKRMGEPSEIANTVYFLGSEEASYISGQTLIVDGGGYRD